MTRTAKRQGAGQHGGQKERCLPGIAASAGLALGRLQVLRAESDAAATPCAAQDAETQLADALERAAARLEELMADCDEMAGEILGFQLALLNDPELVAPARDALAAGEAAEVAWERAIGTLIDDYEAEADDYFRARAEDLRDLRRRVSDLLAGRGRALNDIGADAILVCEELTPTAFLEVDWQRARGAALARGSATSHVAMLARARAVPLLLGLGEEVLGLESGVQAVLDALEGRLIVDPSAERLTGVRSQLTVQERECEADAQAARRPGATADGQSVAVLINVDDPGVLSGVSPNLCDGIGLTRTEFLFREGPADEEAQFAAYRKIILWAEGKSVTIRTLDAGGDKPVPGVTPEGESNPFLGMRGLRLSLARRDLFKTQLRALVRAGQEGPLKIMLPMVTVPAELTAAREVLREVVAELEPKMAELRQPELGIMVETPAAALAIDNFEADFFSIGTNDLVQYVTAAARDIPDVAGLQDPLLPPVLELLARVATSAKRRGIELSVCGEMAARGECIPALLDAGVRSLSVPPASIGRCKRALAAYGGKSPS